MTEGIPPFTMEAKGQNIFNLRSFCVITGASKGLGKCMSVHFAKNLPPNSLLLLLARSVDGLEKTKQEIAQSSPDVKVKIHGVDLGEKDTDDFDTLIQQVLKEYSVTASDFEQGIIVHNAASLGDVSKKLVDQDNTEDLGKFWKLNLTSLVALNTAFLKHFTEDKMKQRLVINISSICALQPFKSWSLYCSAKAARDMLMRTLAVEEASIRVLNYAPGPIDTDMQLAARTKTADEELRDMFSGLHEDGLLLTSEQSIGKLVKLLQENSFDTGAHIDYYDCP